MMTFLIPIVFVFLTSSSNSLPVPIPNQRFSAVHPLLNSHDEPTTPENDIVLFLITIITIGTLLLSLLVILIVFVIRWILQRTRSVKLENNIPGAFDDEFEIEERLQELSPNEQHLFRNGQDYIKQYPPIQEPLTLSAHLAIQEKGIEAWEFIPDLNLPHDCIFVSERTELTFTNFDYQCSIQSNLPIPKINDVYYYEAKIYNFDSPESSIISVGLSTKPYPYFRLPGRHLYSVAYDSNGSRRVNNSFKLTEPESSVFPPLQQGDVIGIGYRVRSGTIFFTRNGKKLSEKSIGGHVKGMKMSNIFPTIGSNNPCSIHVNLGQSGYVFIEANVKKWGYGAKEGTRPPLPDYYYSNQDLLLESSNEDDDDDIINPPDFYEAAGYESSDSLIPSVSNDNITLDTILPEDPPLYQDDIPENNNEIIASFNAEQNQFLGIDDILDDLMGTTEEYDAFLASNEA